MADEVREYNVDISVLTLADLPLIVEGAKAPGGIAAWVAMIAKCVGLPPEDIPLSDVKKISEAIVAMFSGNVTEKNG